jgi:uncharacterized protein (DUF1800 family)
MKRLAFVLGLATLAIAVPFLATAAGRFDQKLSKDQRIVHALNRLTFGPRPGDIEQVRRIGVEKWIDLQLHPERVQENPALAVRLKPLETLHLSTRQILENYQRRAVNPMAALKKPLPALGPNALLTPLQRQTFLRGSTEEKRALLNSFDAEQRLRALAAIPPDALADLPEVRRESMALRQPPQFVNSELIESKLYRATYSNRQLEEVLVDFWLNHFNVFNGKGPGRMLLTSYERDAIRPFVLGRFEDMLLATARHPAMLFYLDNWQSQAAREDFPRSNARRRQGLNENYGRELLELHTLGVDGGYTQQDVIDVARAFTGWTIHDLNRVAEFQFNPAMHDLKEKSVLGHTIPAGGDESDGLQVLDILARHPSTARFISKKLAQRFVADDPPQALVDRMAETFTKTDGDLRAVLKTMFDSREFFSTGAWQAKLKSPLEMVVSAVRAVDADAIDTFALAKSIAELGQPLYGKAEPTGYSNTGEGWANTAGLLGRMNFASALVDGRLPGVHVETARFDGKPPVAIGAALLSTAPSKQMEVALQAGLQNTAATTRTIVSLVLASPDFQRR